MSVSLTSNFFSNSRGLTLKDGGGITWAINKNTNEVTATAGSAGTATTATNLAAGTANQIPYQTAAATTSFFSAANYGVQIYGATGVPSALAGAAGVLVGSASAIPAWSTTPTLTGTNFTGVPNSALSHSSITITAAGSLSGSGTVSLGGAITLTGATLPVGANPTASIGLSAVNGVATSFMRSDGAPALDVTISPTWTGAHTFSVPTTTVVALNTTAASGGFVRLQNSGTTAAFIGTGSATITGAALGDLCLTANGSGVLRLGYNGGAGTALAISSAGASTFSGEVAINGGTPTAALSGFGSPSGSVTSGLTSGATLAQTAGTLAGLLAYLKTIGFIAA